MPRHVPRRPRVAPGSGAHERASARLHAQHGSVNRTPPGTPAAQRDRQGDFHDPCPMIVARIA